jgi:Ca-activated chloride channel family protein
MIKAYSEYKNKKYTKAILLYKRIEDSNYIIYYNLGNCYAMLHQYKLAIAFYKNSLKYQTDSDALSNLSLIKKLYQKEEDIRNKSKKATSTIKSHEADEIDIENDTLSTGIDGKNNKGSRRVDNISNQMHNSSDDEIYIPINYEQNQTKIEKKYLFNDIQERRYDKQLSNRKLHTLLIPLENTKGTDEQYPW